MPDSSFSTANQMATTEVDPGKAGTTTLFNKIRDRDIELIDLMSVFGGPLSVGAGSAVTHEGDVTISANQTLSGLHYYNNLTIDSGVTVTADGPLVIVFTGTMDMTGATIDADGQGAAAGVYVNESGSPAANSAQGVNGSSAAGGGGADNGTGVGDIYSGNGGGINFLGTTLEGGARGDSNASGPGVTPVTPDYVIASLIQSPMSGLLGGASGGSFLTSGGDTSGFGGAGGGVVIIIGPTFIGTNGVITANGLNGQDDGIGASGGGGGGFVCMKVKSYTALLTLAANGGLGGVSTDAGTNNDGADGAAGVVHVGIYG